jgi:hypothetical protein
MNVARPSFLRRLLSLPAAALAIAPLLTPACGVKAPDSATVPEGCHALTVTQLTRGTVDGRIEGKATTADGSGPDQGYSFRIELDEPKGTKLTPGSFDLSKEPSYGTAAHSVLVWEGGDDPTTASTVFFQASGTMQLDVISSPPSGESKGSLTGVKLLESKIDETSYASAPVSDPRCVYVVSAAWDTTVSAGTKCTAVDDCGDTSTKVCDPTTRTCVKSQCDSDTACGTGKTCIVQAADSRAGACYTTCKPLSSGTECGSDGECVVVRFDQTLGICKARGAATEGGDCAIADVTTSCAAGMVCSPEHAGNLCRKQCDYFNQTDGQCPTSQHCVLGSVCTDEPIDPAAIDGNCDGSSAEGTPCAYAAGKTSGMCVAEMATGGQVIKCRKICRKGVAGDCATGKTCADYYDSTGVCR